MTGALCAALALSSPGRRSYFAAAAALLGYGVLIPICSPRQFIIAGGVAMVFTGLATAAIQAWQLRSAGGRYEPVAH
jgi:hypothetical protein